MELRRKEKAMISADPKQVPCNRSIYSFCDMAKCFLRETKTKKEIHQRMKILKMKPFHRWLKTMKTMGQNNKSKLSHYNRFGV